MSRSRTRNRHVAAKAITHRRARLHVKRIIDRDRDMDAKLPEMRFGMPALILDGWHGL